MPAKVEEIKRLVVLSVVPCVCVCAWVYMYFEAPYLYNGAR